LETSTEPAISNCWDCYVKESKHLAILNTTWAKLTTDQKRSCLCDSHIHVEDPDEKEYHKGNT